MDESTSQIIKICGLSNVESLSAVVDSGASHVGFMFAASRRQVSLDQAARLIAGIRGEPIVTVGVVVNETPECLNELARTTGIDMIQLSGDETVDMLDRLEMPVWNVFRFGENVTLDDARAQIDPWLAARRPIAAVMVDASVPGVFGGSGHRANWELAAQLAEIYPLILAGGLNRENVGEAVSQVRPLGVDVSSGVERDGAKDVEKIGSFVRCARHSFSSSR